jgi:hypothetical protein
MINPILINSFLYIYLFILFFIYPIKVIIVSILTLINELFIKNIIKENRPNGIPYGMPSSHAFAYSLLTILLINNNSTFIENLLFIISLILLLITFISKVINNEHSIKQYIIGSCFGGIIGYFINTKYVISI